MMLKQRSIFVGIILCFCVGSAHATISRLSTFGTQPVFTSTLGALPNSVTTSVVNGSLWYDDDSNIFYNPSYALEYRNAAYLQRGAEAGAYLSLDEVNVLGVYVNRGGSLGHGSFNDPGVYTSGAQYQYAPGLIGPGIRELNGFNGTNYYTGGTEGASMHTGAPLDLIFASDYGMKWGVHLAAAKNSAAFSSSEEKSASYWHGDVGIQFLGFEPFLGTTFSSTVETQKNGVSSSQGTERLQEWNLGTRFKYESWNGYFIYKYFNVSGTPLTAGRELSTEMRMLGAGVGHEVDVLPELKLLGHLGAFLNFVDDADSTLSSNVYANIFKGYTEFVVPMNFAMEYQMSSDIELRFGLTYDILRGTNIDNAEPQANTAKANLRHIPEARVGALYALNDWIPGASIDAVVGNGYATRNARDSSENIGFENQFFAMASATYRWGEAVFSR